MMLKGQDIQKRLLNVFGTELKYKCETFENYRCSSVVQLVVQSKCSACSSVQLNYKLLTACVVQLYERTARSGGQAGRLRK